MTIENDLLSREKCRRKVLNTLREACYAQTSFDRISRSLAWLKRLENLDAAHPIGPAAHMTPEQVKEAVPITDHNFVKWDDVPEPWLTRWSAVGRPFTMSGPHPYHHDFLNFLELWDKETNLETAESHAQRS